MSKTEYRLTMDRPVHGRLRKKGSTVFLTAVEAAAEEAWGGLEPVTAEAATDAPGQAVEAEDAGGKAPSTRRTKG